MNFTLWEHYVSFKNYVNIVFVPFLLIYRVPVFDLNLVSRTSPDLEIYCNITVEKDFRKIMMFSYKV